MLLNGAVRRSYGVTPQNLTTVYDDETSAALWTWELTQPSLYFNATILKSLLAHRLVLSQLNYEIAALHKVITKVNNCSALKDLNSIEKHHASYIKIVQKR